MRRLIEKHRRKPEFDATACTAVELANGQEWYLARPAIQITPVFQDSKAVAGNHLLTCGDELDLLLGMIAEQTEPTAQILAVLTLGAFLLLENYDLEDSELERLLIYRHGEPRSEAMVKGIIDVATGHLSQVFARGALSDPKPAAVGCPSA